MPAVTLGTGGGQFVLVEQRFVVGAGGVVLGGGLVA